ncbi:TolC family protein [Ulvibacterium sp.]|uniref:TolC family protein n=1 Tax=Ulvibacterium sp. TaxID=2665914 RepID=UPI00261EEE7C|nr:TolC family protein [Ulvibacterium sp.]
MKNYLYKWTLVLCAFAKTVTFSAQDRPKETLSLEQAIALSLENNQSIQIEQKLVTITEEQVSIGNAGLLPTLNLIGEANYTNNETDLTIRTFQPPPNPATVNFDENGVTSTTISGVVQADYTIFAGFSGRYRYKLLKNQNSIAKYQQQAIINNTVLEVSTLFLEIAKLQRRQELLEKNIQITEDRKERFKDKKLFGQATGLDVLNVESNVNRDQTQLDQILLAKNTLKRSLNFLIGYEPERRYWVSVTYTIDELQSPETIKAEIVANNPSLLLVKEGIHSAKNEIGLARSRNLPRLGVFANYGYFNQENDLQQLAEITNLGYMVGGRLTFNIFNGGQTKTAIKTAKLNKEVNELQEIQLADRLITDAITEINRIEILKTQLVREKGNLLTFQEAYNRTEERFRNGTVTNLDLRDAQTALLNAEIVIAELQADLMKAHITINALKGKI